MRTYRVMGQGWIVENGVNNCKEFDLYVTVEEDLVADEVEVELDLERRASQMTGVHYWQSISVTEVETEDKSTSEVMSQLSRAMAPMLPGLEAL